MIVEEILAYCRQYANFSSCVIAVNCSDMDNRKNYKNGIFCGRKNNESG